MSGTLENTLQCAACGRTFVQVNAYSIHVGSCRPQKKRMASALEAAKEKYTNKKARLNPAPAQLPTNEAIQPATAVVKVSN